MDDCKSQSKNCFPANLGFPVAELAELVDALDSGSSVCKDFRVQVPGSAFLTVNFETVDFEMALGSKRFVRSHFFKSDRSILYPERPVIQNAQSCKSWLANTSKYLIIGVQSVTKY